MAGISLCPSVCPPDCRFDGDWNFFRISLFVCMAGVQISNSGCPVAFCQCSLRSREPLSVFPVCGCKITTKFRRLQIFLCFSACFPEFHTTISCNLAESTNVKIYFIMLITELYPYSERFTLRTFTQKLPRASLKKAWTRHFFITRRSIFIRRKGQF